MTRQQTLQQNQYHGDGWKNCIHQKKPKRFNAEVLELMNKQAKKDVEQMTIINGVDVPGTIG